MKLRLAKKILADPGRYPYAKRMKAWKRVSRRAWRHSRPKRGTRKPPGMGWGRWWRDVLDRTDELFVESAHAALSEAVTEMPRHFRRYPNPFKETCEVCDEQRPGAEDLAVHR
jgi:hypothetical protein